MKVIWSDRALRSLAQMHARVSDESSEKEANRLIDRLLKRGDQLEIFQALGRKVSHYDRTDIREIIEPPYRIIYRVRKANVEVIDVFHGARRPPWER